jgi:hypothetical protein
MLLSPFMDGRVSQRLRPLATLKWLSASNNTYIGSDSYDAASCYFVAVDSGSGLPLPGGTLTVLPFTVDGGAPANVGDPFWLAAYTDDTNTGRSKATATLPVRVTPSLGVYVKNVAPGGTIASTVNVGTSLAPMYAVKMAVSPAPSRPAIIPDAALAINSINFNGGAQFTAAVALTAQVELLDGESMIFKFGIDEIGSGPTLGSIEMNNTSPGLVTGFQSYPAAGAGGFNLAPRGTGPNIGFSCVPGDNTFCLTRYGGLVHAALNRYPVQTTSDNLFTAGVLGVFQFFSNNANGWLYGWTKLNRAMDDAELLSVSGHTYQDKFALNENLFTPVLTADANCQCYFDATTYVSGTPHVLAGPAGTAFDFTVVGSPTVRTRLYNYNNNPTSLVLGSPAGAVDSDGYVSTRAFSYVGFTVSTMAEWADVIVGLNNLDFDDADEEAAVVIVNGVTMMGIGSDVQLGIPTRTRTIRGATFTDPDILYGQVTSPYHVQILIGEKMARWDSFVSGYRLVSLSLPSTATMDATTASKVAAIISDGYTSGGHGDDLLGSPEGGSAISGAIVTRVRADYPGLVVAPNVMVSGGAGMGMAYMRQWGGGSVVPFTRLIYDSVQASAAGGAVKSYWCFEGAGDWIFETLLSQFATDYALHLDTLHTLDPTAIIIVLLPAQSNLYATSNVGQTLQQFVDAINTICSTRVWITKLDVTGPTAITWRAGTPNQMMIPTQAAGAAALKNNIKTRIHAAQPTVY